MWNKYRLHGHLLWLYWMLENWGSHMEGQD